MADNTKKPEPPKRLTPEDPVAPEVMKKLNELEEGRLNIAVQLLGLEQSRIRLLAAAHQVDEQQQRLFEQILMERGLPVQTQMEVDSKTGIVKLFEPKVPPPKT